MPLRRSVGIQACPSASAGYFFAPPPLSARLLAQVQPLLQERTRRKIMILGTDFLPTLKQVIDEDNIPTIFGGKSEIADLKVSVGPWASSAPSTATGMAGGKLAAGSSPESPTLAGGEASLPDLPAAAAQELGQADADMALLGGSSQTVTVVA